MKNGNKLYAEKGCLSGDDFSFLKDELALLEIRKHKWVESERTGREIGFASAAYDWINQYGYAWKQFYLDREE